jgi:hypothetical protein
VSARAARHRRRIRRLARSRAERLRLAKGLSDFLVMSSGETASLRLFATLATTSSVPRFGIAHLRSLDEEGQRLVDDWCAVIRAY